METRRWPTELRLSKDRRTLRIAFDDGSAFDLAAEYLRVASPSAEVQGHSPSERKTVAGKRDVDGLSTQMKRARDPRDSADLGPNSGDNGSGDGGNRTPVHR